MTDKVISQEDELLTLVCGTCGNAHKGHKLSTPCPVCQPISQQSARALLEAAKKACVTFLDFERILKLLGHPVAAKAARLAADCTSVTIAACEKGGGDG